MYVTTLVYVQVELVAQKTWITFEWKQLHIQDLYHWKSSHAEAVKIILFTINVEESYSKTQYKSLGSWVAQFGQSIMSSMIL